MCKALCLLSKAMNLNQVTVQSINIDESISFYKLLGLNIIVQSEHYARFELPQGDSTFSVYLTEKPSASKTVIYFEVNDLLKTHEKLTAAGVKFSTPPTKEPWLWHEARLHDPSGNEICIYSAGTNRKHPPWRVS